MSQITDVRKIMFLQNLNLKLITETFLKNGTNYTIKNFFFSLCKSKGTINQYISHMNCYCAFKSQEEG